MMGRLGGREARRHEGQPSSLRGSVTSSLGLLLLLAVVAPGCARSDPNVETVVIGGETFHLERAADEAAREQGLMRRAALPEDGGMLFVFPQVARRSFWMGHCLVDIDIMFLDARGRVTALHRMKAEPPQDPGESDLAYDARMPRYESVYPAQFAIELPAGSLDRLGIRVDDRIELDLQRLKDLAR
jgi:hypothetical protein